jgi:hypothetical protein
LHKKGKKKKKEKKKKKMMMMMMKRLVTLVLESVLVFGWGKRGPCPGRLLRGGAEKAVTDRPHVNT